MHRVVTIQSLKFAEIREQENQRKEEKYQSSTQHQSRQKKHEEKQSDDTNAVPTNDQSASQTINPIDPEFTEKSITITYHDKRDTQSNLNQSVSQSSSQSANQTILLVDDVIRRRRDALHRPPRGVWNQLGVAYEVDGVDLTLGNMSKQAIKEAIKSRKPRATQPAHNAVHDKDATYPTRKVEALVEAFRQARIKMLQTSHEPMRRTDEQSIHCHAALNVALNPVINALNVGSVSKQNRLPSIHDSPSRQLQSNQPVTVTPSNQAITPSLPFHFAGSRVDHISRWRAQFDSTKQTNDRELIKKLVARAETRGAVFQQIDYMENALQTIMKRKSGKRAQSVGQSMRMDERWQAAIEQEFGFELKSPTQPKSNEVIEREIREALELKHQAQQSVNTEYEEKLQL